MRRSTACSCRAPAPASAPPRSPRWPARGWRPAVEGSLVKFGGFGFRLEYDFGKFIHNSVVDLVKF